MIIYIPIKHNSQRVPRKNFRFFGEEPLYKHTLLKYSKYKVYVDTDSAEITDGITTDKRLKHVTVVPRQEQLKGDLVSVCALLKDFILRYKITDTIAQIHVTSPFLEPSTVAKAESLLGEYDSVASATVHQTRFWRKEEYGFCPVNHNPIKMEQTQDLPAYYEENSAFYIFHPGLITMTGSRIGSNPYFYPLGIPQNADIDTEDDWNSISLFHNNLRKGERI